MAIEVGAGQVHAVAGQDVVAALERVRDRDLARSGPTRTSEKSEVPPPMSAHEHQLFAVDVAFMVQRGSDGFKLETAPRQSPLRVPRLQAPRAEPGRRGRGRG